jgi:hypothetical protein
MANFKLTELNSISDTVASGLIYTVQDDLSKSITIENFFHNIPAPVTTTGGFDVVNPGINGGEYLSGGQPLAVGLASTLASRNTREVLFIENTTNDPFTWPGGSDTLTQYGNSVVNISGGTIAPASEIQRLNVTIPNSTEEALPDGWNIKLVQIGELPIHLNVSPGVTVLSVNNTLSSGYSGAAGEIPYSSMEVYLAAEDKFVVTHSLSCNGLGTNRSDWV